MSSVKQRIDKQLFGQVDASSLVVFRFMFGLMMLIEVVRYFSHGWIDHDFIEPGFMFKFYGFGWIEAMPSTGMYLVFVVMGVSAVCIMIGALYRIATVVFFLTFCYVFFLDMATYLNHFYLVILVALLMMVVPANRSWAVDAWVRPRTRSDTVPGWAIWVFRLQFEVVLLYAGIVKLNADWLRLEPMGMWLAQRVDFPLIGQFFAGDWAVMLASYGIIALHLIGAPLLLFRRTRMYVLVVYFIFHLMNVALFSIGIFPWMTMAATLMFLAPDWPVRFVRTLNRWQARGSTASTGGRPVSEVVPKQVHGSAHTPSRRSKLLVVTLMGIWLAFQILFPLRHLLYPGYASWTEEGRKFAWQMKLRDKKVRALFLVRNPATMAVQQVMAEDYLRPHQVRKMVRRPEMILQFAHHLGAVAREQGIGELEVWARICVSLNGRKEAWLIDPFRDLAQVERSWRAADWILPLEHPPERPPNPRGRENLRCQLPAPTD